MNIRVKCTNKALPNYGETRDFSTVKDYLLYDRAGFDDLRTDEGLSPLTDEQVDKVVEYIESHYEPMAEDKDFSVDSEDGSYEVFANGDGSFQDFYNFVSDIWLKADWLDKSLNEVLDMVDEALASSENCA